MLKKIFLIGGFVSLLGFIGLWIGQKILIKFLEEKAQTKIFQTSLSQMENWFIRNQTETGDFHYELNTTTGQTSSNYNIVRQAGVLYSLAQAYKYHPSSQLKKTIEKEINFFKEYWVVKADQPGIAMIVYQGKQKNNTEALLLLGLAELIESDPNLKSQYWEMAQQLANFLVTTQKDKGGFWYEGNSSSPESDYNNGETFYALVKFYRLDPDPKYLTSINKAANYFLKKYPPTNFNSSFFSWGMAGFANLYQVDHQEIYWQYLKDSTENFRTSSIGKNIINKNDSHLRGGWGVFLEGTAFTAWVAKDKDHQYHDQLAAYIKNSLDNLLSLQIDGPRGKFTSDFENIKGGLCNDSLCQSQRIDITHHNLSALILYLSLVK
ncbi:hypothetical protein A2160_05455 [Candidatus Beckwithbacteria bacterium RBG_13_42_9]|uniref:Uncharacterized protein n=1 Tax=Candidatus Beckwithbacteria bacterium RBG_13_42_9 TaxID=1797457 RepID=A0A1F5E738_9BACT|nr:MAG: hypothetical protein A2160_05455 [Candidatus Beckwithbacteria bacterium RBG_13_42_9]